MTMTWLGPRTLRASVAGRVVDGETHRPVPGAIVDLVRAASPAVRGRATSAADGAFQVTGLPAGAYDVTCHLPATGLRYGWGKARVDITGGARVFVDLPLPPTGLKGKVVSPVDGSVYPRVRLTGSADDVYGSADGAFRLLCVEPGARRLVITAPGCLPFETDVSLTRGEVLDLGDPIQLAPNQHHPFGPQEPPGNETPTE